MCRARYLAVVIYAILCGCLAASASPLVTGKGFGFAVVSPQTGTVTKFYAHPYSFARPDPQNPLSEGVETANFIKAIGWDGAAVSSASGEYVEDSHVIRVRSSAGEGLCFMPFGLRHAALIISWETGSAAAQGDRLYVEWNRPIESQRVVRMFGDRMQLLKFGGIQESLLLIPLERKRVTSAGPQQYLSTNRAWALVSLENDGELERTVREFSRWRAGLAPGALAKREIAEIERWRVKPAVHFPGEKERHLWRQSEIVLRMAQSREPNRPGRNNNGLILASLPDGVWLMPWVRDMAYATVALARMGHRNESACRVAGLFQRSAHWRDARTDAWRRLPNLRRPLFR